MNIPKIIHYVWLGDKEKPELFYRCLESWKKYCPDYEIKEWNEKNFDFSESRFAKEAYSQKKWGFVPDYIRARVLHDFGGIYLDTDVEITKPFDDLLDNEFLISFENDVYLETAVLASKPKHPFLKKMCNFYKNHPFIKKNGKIDYTPSTPIWTCFLEKYYNLKLKSSNQLLKSNIDESTVTVLSNEYFCPINYTTKKLNKTENTYAIHYFDASWFSNKLKTREKFLKFLYSAIGEKTFSFFTKLYVKKVKKNLKNEL